MPRRRPTWAQELADEEVRYVHPLTRAVLSLVTRGGDAMPTRVELNDLEGVARDVAEESHRRVWRGAALPGDRLIAALPAGATVELRGAGEHAEVTVTRAAWVMIE
eukprot:8048672-Lingulodinium_polyedra.AAC.1